MAESKIKRPPLRSCLVHKQTGKLNWDAPALRAIIEPRVAPAPDYEYWAGMVEQFGEPLRFENARAQVQGDDRENQRQP